MDQRSQDVGHYPRRWACCSEFRVSSPGPGRYGPETVSVRTTIEADEFDSYLFHNMRKPFRIKSLQISVAPPLQLCTLLCCRLDARYNGDGDVFIRRASENELRSEASAETTVARKRFVDKALEHTTLAGRLITHDDNLRKVDEVSHTTCEELVDLLELRGVGQSMSWVNVCCGCDHARFDDWVNR